MDDKQFVLDFIKQQKLMVIATVNPQGHPEDAVVSFDVTNQNEVIFATMAITRKAQNIHSRPQVAVVIGWDDLKTVQLQGTAQKLSVEEMMPYKDSFLTKNPHAKHNDTNPEWHYFKITPTWIRYTDISQHPWKIIELNF